jgi:hypothetical protein
MFFQSTFLLLIVGDGLIQFFELMQQRQQLITLLLMIQIATEDPKENDE